MKRIPGICLAAIFGICLSLTLPDHGSSQTQAAVSGKNASEYVRVLTAPDFQARKGGLEGGLKASAWIADQFKAWGLEPAGPNGYFQDFKKPVFHVRSAALSIDQGQTKRTFAYDEEWRVQEFSGSGDIRGELVFAGYGVVLEKENWDEFEGLVIKDKIVLFIGYGSPSFLAEKAGSEALPEAKIARAYELGARAVIMVNAPRDILSSLNRYPFPAMVMMTKEKYKPDMVVAGINDDVVKFIFRDSGIDLWTRVQRMEREKKPASESLGIQAELKVETTHLPEAPLRNVLAKIEGNDRLLKDEFIVVGAHMDGLGLSPESALNPGADDNASGTAVVMEVARAMKAARARPKRTVVFALWDGEEQGLWGSIHYCQNPAFPLDKTMVNLNLDMVGNGDGRLHFRGIYYAPEIWEMLKTGLPSDIIKGVVPARGGPGGSDHTPFLAKGIPGFFIQTMGDHYGRHDVGDKFELVDPTLLEKAGVFVRASLGVLTETKGLKAQPGREEFNILRSATIVDLNPRDAGELVKNAAAVDFFDLDFALVSLAGESPLDLAKNLFETTASVRASKNVVFYQPPSLGQLSQRFGEKIGVLAGITDIGRLAGHDFVLKMMGRSGLGFVVVRDKDFAEGAVLERLIKAANEEGVLVIARLGDVDNIKKILATSLRSGLLVIDNLDAEIIKALKQKRWRLAPEWKSGMNPENYAAKFQSAVKELGPSGILIDREDLPLKGFPPELVKLISLIKPKVMTESQMMSGGMDQLGQNFLNLLREIRPPSN
jgi:hypothetical protein